MTHDELVLRAVRWLRQAVYAKNPEPKSALDRVWYKPACGVAVPELVSGNYAEIPDAFGWDRDCSWLIECKTSRADFRSDRKKLRTAVGTYRFYLCPPGLIQLHELEDGWGLLYCHPRIVKVVAWSARNEHRNIRGELSMMYSLLRRVSKRGLIVRCLAKKWGGDGLLPDAWQ